MNAFYRLIDPMLRPHLRGTTMTAPWFDAAIGRAMMENLTVYQGLRPDTYLVDSESRGVLHTCTRTSCTCSGFGKWERCLHVALVIAATEIWGQDLPPAPKSRIIRSAA